MYRSNYFGSIAAVVFILIRQAFAAPATSTELSPCVQLKSVVNLTKNSSLGAVEALLRDRLKNEKFLSGETAIVYQNSTGCPFTVSATIDLTYQGYVVILDLVDIVGGYDDQKAFPIIDVKNLETSIELMMIKIRQFIANNRLGTISLTSLPIECDVSVNGAHVGYTPLNILLTPGTYYITMTHPNTFPFADSVLIPSRTNVPLKVTLPVKGVSVMPLYAGSAVSLVAALTFGVFQSYFHNQYISLQRFENNGDGGYRRIQQQRYDDAFIRYRNSSMMTLGSSVVFGCFSIGSVIQSIRKKQLERQLYSTSSLESEKK